MPNGLNPACFTVGCADGTGHVHASGTSLAEWESMRGESGSVTYTIFGIAKEFVNAKSVHFDYLWRRISHPSDLESLLEADQPLPASSNLPHKIS